MSIVLDGTGTITGLTATGISAVQQLPSGSVLQVVNAQTTTDTTTSGTTYVDTTLTATITPKFATSKILVLLNQNGLGRSAGGNAGDAIALILIRNSTTLATPTVYSTYTGGAVNAYGFVSTLSYLDSPATTSATTYKTQFKNDVVGGPIYVNRNNSISTITLMEIAA